MSRAYRYFHHVLKDCFGIEPSGVISGELSVEELWRSSSQLLLKQENSLLGLIENSNLDTLCVATSPSCDETVEESIGKTKLKKILCPLGLTEQPFNLFEKYQSFEELQASIRAFCEREGEGAIFPDALEFEFEKPNPYVAKAAYEKQKNAQTLKYSELKNLKTQLCRDVIEAFASKGEAVWFVLHKNANFNIMYQTEQLLDYIDQCDFAPIKIFLCVNDLVGLNFASSMIKKRYKKITVEAALGGNDCCQIDGDALKYWGHGKLPKSFATLSKTPASFAKIN